MDQTDAQMGSEEGSVEEGREKRSQRSYASYKRIAKLSFDPMKDLNLPGSYDEVVERFKRLQIMRAMEAFN